MRVLIIDDDFHILRIVEDRLKAENFEVLKASDGIEGLRLVYDFKPDLILLDIMMPTIDGHGVLQCIKRDEKIKNIPVIMMTAKRERADVMQAAQGGAAEYIVKPIDFRMMVKKIYDATHAVPPPPKETEGPGNINVKAMAMDLANLSVEMDAVAQSAGIPPEKPEYRSSSLTLSAEVTGLTAVATLSGPLRPSDLEMLRSEIRAIIARGIANIVFDTTNIQSLDITEVMLIKEVLDYVQLNRGSACIVETDQKRRRFIKQCKLHLDYSQFDTAAAAVKFFEKS